MQRHNTSKKTLTNQLINAGSSDNRRINADIVPAFASDYRADPGINLINSAINIGSPQNPWKSVSASIMSIYTPRVAFAVTIAPSMAPTGNPAPVTVPSTNGGNYWAIVDIAQDLREVWRWTGTEWENYTSRLSVGATFYAPRRLYTWCGPPNGLGSYGLRRTATVTLMNP